MMPGLPVGYLLLVLLAAFAVGGATSALLLSVLNSPDRPAQPAYRPPAGRHRAGR